MDKSSKKGKPTSTGTCQNCPSFNKDGNHATPSFILPSEKVFSKISRATTKYEEIRYARSTRKNLWTTVRIRVHWFVFNDLERAQAQDKE